MNKPLSYSKSAGTSVVAVILLAATAFSLLAPASVSAQAAGQEPETSPSRYDYFGGLDLGPTLSPRAALGYEIGDHFTRHSDLVRYFEKLAAVSDRVAFTHYGRSHQRRSLQILTISSAQNLARLDEILAANRALSDPGAIDQARVREICEKNPAIVWFSYNVHGNEASASETAIQVAYTLAAARNDEVKKILDRVVVVIDPMLNPDGHERYVSFFQNTVGRTSVTNPDAAEHDEPWPGGRTNHYHFDLNRDWLWLTQPESQQRLAIYQRYLPQLHVDYHEQGYRRPYFFGAGDTPYNANIPEETKKWIDAYGEANAKVFDKEGLVYSTRERFDYLYMGYGKTMPVYHGAVGLLCEKGGHGKAGLGIRLSDQYTLTLTERVRHHFLTSMSYLETTAAFRQRQLERFAAFFADSVQKRSGTDEPWGYVIPAGEDPRLLERVWRVCQGHGVEIHELKRATKIPDLETFDLGYRWGNETEIAAGSWVLPLAQPRRHLLRALFERRSKIEDCDTYDITAWSLPITFGLEAFTSFAPVSGASRLDAWAPAAAKVVGDGNVALIIDSRAHDFPRAAAAVIRHELFARVTGSAIEIDGRKFDTGSFVIHRVRNPKRDLNRFTAEVIAAGVDVFRAARGVPAAGKALGANHHRLYQLPRIGLLRGRPTTSYSYGQHWHALDVVAKLPHTAIEIRSLGRIDLSQFNVIVFPDATRIDAHFGEADRASLDTWVRAGGVLVASGATAKWALDRLARDTKPSSEVRGAKDEEPYEPEDPEAPGVRGVLFGEREKAAVENRVPGTLLRATIDLTHPLAGGCGRHRSEPPFGGDSVGILKRSRRTLEPGVRGYAVATFDDDRYCWIAGSISEANKRLIEKTAAVVHEPLGKGEIIAFVEDPTFRGFKLIELRLLLNAIIYGPTL